MVGVLKPDSGTIATTGRISPLLELGAGFNAELTGVENVFLNGVLLGMTRQEVQSRLTKIIEFSELGAFIREPVRTYSAGMVARLGFSVAVHVDPEILLIDEILAVGDEAFQAKCMERIREFHNNGVTTVIVTHSLSLAEQLCDRVGVLHESRLVGLGDPTEMVQLCRNILAGHEVPLPVSQPEAASASA
jgi:lipopolysaccharide transport system ATP-binding protein